ncbi:MAG: peptidoglycan editing factor PgeF [Phycisphaerae bacterium]|nr:peptidoglycan editing factor PgeF [Phycisphaerae bacterium]
MRLSATELDCPALVRHVHASGVVVYRSALLDRVGFRHGFSTRHGGVSAAPFDTLNLGVAQTPGEPDSDANIARNAALLMEAIEATECEMVRVRQVHGCGVRMAERDDRFGPPSAEADAIVSVHPTVAPCIRTADCVPVLLACTATGAVASVHAGWRSIVAGVVGETIRAMATRGVHAQDLAVAIGPGIGCGAFEVGEEVAQAFGVAGLDDHVVRSPEWPKPHVDCAAAVRAQLLACGVQPNRIEGGGLCTVRMAREFFSYRRDGARSGRMGAVIVPRY